MSAHYLQGTPSPAYCLGAIDRKPRKEESCDTHNEEIRPKVSQGDYGGLRNRLGALGNNMRLHTSYRRALTC